MKRLNFGRDEFPLVELKCDHCQAPVMSCFPQALCPPCYAKHREALLTRSKIRAEHDDCLWREWLAEKVTEDYLLAHVHDKSGIRQLMERVKTQRSLKANKSKGR